MESNYILKDKNILCSLTYGNSLEKLKKHGILNRELEIYEELTNYFNKVYLLNFGNNIVSDQKYNFQIINIKQNKNIFLNFISNIFFMRKIKKKLKVHFIRTNQTFGSIFFIILKIIFRSKLITRMGHESFYFVSVFGKSKIKKFFFYLNNKLIYLFSDYVFVPNNEIKKYINEVFDTDLKKINVIQNYISKEFFEIHETSSSKSNSLIYIGRVNYQKIDKDFIEIIKKMNIQIDVYGNIEDEEVIKENNFLNYKGIISNDQIPDIMKNYKYYILLSKIDQNPKSVLEAMQCGLITITIQFFGSDFLIHKYNSLVLKKNNFKEIHNLIMNQDTDLEKNIIKNSMSYTKYLSSKYNAEKEVKIIE
ncbi:glycosyltransferase [Alphaproteobacteria bacterium]|nr:glycosyltransferase [Alphaproteobacteria bacterium]